MMNAKVKSSIILLVTLLIGVAIGYELNGILFRYRFDAQKKMLRPEGFVNHFVEVIKPEETQKNNIRSTILKYHTRIEKLSKESMTQVEVLVDSMCIELRPQLNKEQISRLDGMIQRMKKSPRPDKMPGPDQGPGPGPNHGPGGPGFGPEPGNMRPRD